MQMDRLAKQQTCQLFIEQEIQKGLAEGKSLHAIGKDIAKEIGRIFLVSVPADTIRKRASRIKAEQGGTNVPPEPTTQNDSDNSNLEKLENTTHGGAREGAGRPAAPKDDRTGVLQDGQSHNLGLLKGIWVKTTKADRKRFLGWIQLRNELKIPKRGSGDGNKKDEN